MNFKKRKVFIFVAIFLLLSGFNTYGYDRYGSDYPGSASLVSTPTECASRCDSDPRCQSWTFVKPPIKHPTNPVCFLKDAVPEASFNPTCPSNNECLSGVKDSRGQWCGENQNLTVVPGVAQSGQGVVVDCHGLTCSGIQDPPKQKAPWYLCIWALFIPPGCHSEPRTISGDFFCH
jgi:hypothetical protein